MFALHSPRKYLAITLLLVSVTPAFARAQNRPNPAKVPVVYRVPDMERAVVQKGVVFDSSSSRPLAFDAYIPDKLRKGEHKPAIIFVSGAEQVRDWLWFVTWGQLAAAHGFVGIVPDKRYPRGIDGTRAGFEDTEKLLAFLETQGDRLSIDPRRICLWTFSAGGRLTSVGLQPGKPAIKCLVSFYGVLDLSGELPEGAKQPERESFLSRYSPLQAMESLAASGSKPPPIFLARAGRDVAFINSGIDRFTSSALRLNVHITVMNYADGEHAFDGYNDTPQSRAIIKAALQFVQEQTAAR